MTKTTIYHNPRCTKSRETLALLQQRGIDPEVVEYLRTPLDVETLQAVLRLLGRQPSELIRTKEYEALGLPPTDDPEELIARIVAYPHILQRPIVVHGDQARVGRPPEAVLEIL